MTNLTELINELSDFLADSTTERDIARDSYKALERFNYYICSKGLAEHLGVAESEVLAK